MASSTTPEWRCPVGADGPRRPAGRDGGRGDHPERQPDARLGQCERRDVLPLVLSQPVRSRHRVGHHAPHERRRLFARREFGTQIQNDLASDGTVLGYKGSGTSKAFYIRLPSGTETPVNGLHLANAVNASHVVAGAIYGPSLSDPLHAAIWANGKVTDLNTLLPPGTTGWDLIEATAINDNGDIAGIAAHDGQSGRFPAQHERQRVGQVRHDSRNSRSARSSMSRSPSRPARST